jgi:hypothetical protein
MLPESSSDEPSVTWRMVAVMVTERVPVGRTLTVPFCVGFS